MKKVIIGLISILTVIPLFQSCITSKATKAQRVTVESGQIPPDMATEDFTLIGTLQGRRSYDKYVKKAFKNYTGKYVLATEAEITDKYDDKDKFRYILDCNLEFKEIIRQKRTPGTNIVNSDRQQMTYFQYYIFDRKYGKEYSRSHSSSMFSYEMRVYLMAIDRIRKK